MAKLVEATDYMSHAPTNAINYAYYRGVEATGFWFQFTPGVNAGIIPTNENLCCVFVARASERMADFSVDPETEFNRLLRQGGADLWGVVAAGSRVSEFRGTSLPGFLRQAWGPGWALVGDAGYTKDPISAHGISDGLRDAELCARAVDRALSYPGDVSAAMSEYQQTRDHAFHRDVSGLGGPGPIRVGRRRSIGADAGYERRGPRRVRHVGIAGILVAGNGVGLSGQLSGQSGGRSAGWRSD